MDGIDDALLTRALAGFAPLASAAARPLRRGLINQTFLVDTAGGRYVLQRLSSIFTGEVNGNVKAVTEHLAAHGLATPRILETRDGRPWLDLGDDGVWRALTWVDGATFDTPCSLEQVRSAGNLIGRFHAALADLEHTFVGLRVGVHDTERHLARLRTAVAGCAGHRLRREVAPLATELLARYAELTPAVELVTLIGHGDLKLNNVRFAGEEPPARDRAVCLIDLDTVGPIALAFELGDAWRSWCNPAGEDAGRPIEFDLEVYAASLAGYRAGLGRRLSPLERSQLVDGVEWISLELAVRFAADALDESYFGWDPARFAGRGEHNLHRARVQLELHRSARACRAERARLLAAEHGPWSCAQLS